MLVFFILLTNNKPHNYHFQHFLVRLRSFSGWGQSQVMEMLLRYQPQDTEEVFDILVQ